MWSDCLTSLEATSQDPPRLTCESYLCGKDREPRRERFCVVFFDEHFISVINSSERLSINSSGPQSNSSLKQTEIDRDGKWKKEPIARDTYAMNWLGNHRNIDLVRVAYSVFVRGSEPFIGTHRLGCSKQGAFTQVTALGPRAARKTCHLEIAYPPRGIVSRSAESLWQRIAKYHACLLWRHFTSFYGRESLRLR